MAGGAPAATRLAGELTERETGQPYHRHDPTAQEDRVGHQPAIGGPSRGSSAIMCEMRHILGSARGWLWRTSHACSGLGAEGRPPKDGRSHGLVELL
jgi:hypothetical protein